MRRICRYLPLPVLLLLCLPLVQAQSSVDFNVGFGAAHAKTLGSVDVTTFLPCSAPSSNCLEAPDLSGFMMGFGGNLMLWKHAGVGAEVSLQPGRQDYLTISTTAPGQIGEVIQSRTTFWDINGILAPISTKRAVIQLQGGIGGANVKFYDKQSQSSSVLGNSTFTQFFGSSNHFQLHAGVGVQLYVTDHVFIRPQFDIHYVHNFSQFGSNAVPQGMIWLGYSIGDR